MSPFLPLQSVSAATRSFVAAVLAEGPCRVEARIASQDGMPLLCAVEAVVGATLAGRAALELVWLNRATTPGVHLLQLQAFGADNRLLGAAVHEFAA